MTQTSIVQNSGCSRLKLLWFRHGDSIEMPGKMKNIFLPPIGILYHHAVPASPDWARPGECEDAVAYRELGCTAKGKSGGFLEWGYP